MRNDNGADVFLYAIGILIGFVVGTFIMYVAYIKHNTLIPKDKYECIDAEPIGSDPSIVSCTILLRKESYAYKKYLELSNGSR